jgi:RecA/RadA recombinase
LIAEKYFKIRVLGHSYNLLLPKKVTHVYGPPKIGKSTLAAVLSLELALQGIESIFISTERPIELRFESLIKTNNRYNLILLESITTATILTFGQLKKTILAFRNSLPNPRAKVLIVDSITAAYRTISSSIQLSNLRKILNELQFLAVNRELAVLFTNQVSSIISKEPQQKNCFRPVASASTRNYSDICLRLSRFALGGTLPSFESLSGETMLKLKPFNIDASGIPQFFQLFVFSSLK